MLKANNLAASDIIFSKETFRQNKVVNVKLSGDGTKIGKRLHVVVFTFTIWDEGQTGSAAGNYILAVFKQSESYDCLQLALGDIIKGVEQPTRNTSGGHYI